MYAQPEEARAGNRKKHAAQAYFDTPETERSQVKIS